MNRADVQMLQGSIERMGHSFLERKLRDQENKRYVEKQRIEAAMRERDQKRYDDQKKLAEAMAERDAAMQARRIQQLDEQQANWEKNFARDGDRYLDGIITQSVRDKIESDRYAEQAAARNAATQHGQKMDLSRLDLAMMEHELRKQQLENQPNSTATYGWQTDEEGNPTFGPQSFTTSFRSNGDSIRAQTITPNAADAQTASPSAPQAAAPPTPSTQQAAHAATSPETAPSELQPNLKATTPSTFWRDFGNGAWATTKWLAGANIAPALANSGLGKAVRNQYNEAKEDRAYHAAIGAADRAKPKPPPEPNYAMQQAKDLAGLAFEPVAPVVKPTVRAAKAAAHGIAGKTTELYTANKADRAKHRAAQLEAEERELRRRAERLDALSQAQY